MVGQIFRFELLEEEVCEGSHFVRRGDADGVSDAKLVHSDGFKLAANFQHGGWGYLSGVGALEGGADIASDEAVWGARPEGRGDFLEDLQRLRDGHVDVVLGEGIGCGGEQGDSLDADGHGSFESLCVWDKG